MYDVEPLLRDAAAKKDRSRGVRLSRCRSFSLSLIIISSNRFPSPQHEIEPEVQEIASVFEGGLRALFEAYSTNGVAGVLSGAYAGAADEEAAIAA